MNDREQREIITVLRALNMAGSYSHSRGKSLYRRVGWVAWPTEMRRPAIYGPQPRAPKDLRFDAVWADLVQDAQKYITRWSVVDPNVQLKLQKLQNITTARGATASEAATAARLAQRLRGGR